MAQQEKNRKVRAVLAGGLVLGVGVAVTLAAWNDSEFAEGVFGTGHFNMQGSVDGINFTDHASGAAASLSFAVEPGSMSPEDTVAAPFVLHLDEETTNNAKVNVASALGSGTAVDQLSYAIVRVPSLTDCKPEATGTVIVPPGTAFGAATGVATFDLTKSDVSGEPGADAFLCVQVTAAEDLIQDTSATATWEFVGQSVS
ncbi:hypothetical protein BLJ79_08065 [Arthrobacter sp. UCD-GKA]|uniref:SipW-dependent-type signal peptide-containing protein n=1 Tax=Arthrobacter sp. UCD-GKA TaxID=1913576 RepID=UPI0008DC6524|nr:SipW-dependent-type signal peptide-containing protein [Arthrobacter sp. UCD-GKA]OIH85136.1 hypothetical protein BLJ79_08065 [Arthrobacter sp. UCD-GKA]